MRFVVSRDAVVVDGFALPMDAGRVFRGHDKLNMDQSVSRECRRFKAMALTSIYAPCLLSAHSHSHSHSQSTQCRRNTV